MKIILPEFFFASRLRIFLRHSEAYYFFYLHNIYLYIWGYMCQSYWGPFWLLNFDTLVCNLHNTANKFLYSAQFFFAFAFVFDFVDQRNEFLAFGGWGRGLCVLCLICHVGVLFYVLWGFPL